MANNIDGIVKALYNMGFRGMVKLEPEIAWDAEMTTERQGLQTFCLMHGDTLRVEVGEKQAVQEADVPTTVMQFVMEDR